MIGTAIIDIHTQTPFDFAFVQELPKVSKDQDQKIIFDNIKILSETLSKGNLSLLNSYNGNSLICHSSYTNNMKQINNDMFDIDKYYQNSDKDLTNFVFTDYLKRCCIYFDSKSNNIYISIHFSNENRSEYKKINEYIKTFFEFLIFRITHIIQIKINNIFFGGDFNNNTLTFKNTDYLQYTIYKGNEKLQSLFENDKHKCFDYIIKINIVNKITTLPMPNESSYAY